MKISKKMKNRFITQRTVFGIFNRINMMICLVVTCPKRITKEGYFSGSNNDSMLIFTSFTFATSPMNYLLNILQPLQHFDRWLFHKINGQWTNTFFDLLFLFFRASFFWMPLYLFLFLFVASN
ncbi:MAG TPA: hypothetical protein VGI82_05015, partial [Chitinophagaceae bacterium]